MPVTSHPAALAPENLAAGMRAPEPSRAIPNSVAGESRTSHIFPLRKRLRLFSSLLQSHGAIPYRQGLLNHTAH